MKRSQPFEVWKYYHCLSIHPYQRSLCSHYCQEINICSNLYSYISLFQLLSGTSFSSFFFRYLFLQSHLSLISNSLCQIIITWLFPFCFRSCSHKINLVCNPCLSSLLVASFDLLLTNYLSLIFSSTVFLIRFSWC